jgi:protoporphyrinogen oxidase
MHSPDQDRTLIIGAGPAGLACAWELGKKGRAAVVYEQDDVVGGISRTASYNGYRFDIGGHRFFTKVPLVWEMWREILDEEFLERPRLSRIYYQDKFFDYPLKPLNALVNLGPVETVRICISWAWAQAFPEPEERNFEQWVINRFGRRLYEIFFKTYTEKVWGTPCTEIGSDWAAQRIKNLDLLAALKDALLSSSSGSKGEIVSTL